MTTIQSLTTSTGLPVRKFPTIGIVLPYLSRTDHLEQSVQHWLAQDYNGRVDVVVVDFSDQPTTLDVSHVRLVRPSSLTWNSSYARNVGACAGYGELLVYASVGLLPGRGFVAHVVSKWDQADLWLSEGQLSGVPHDPALDELFAVKRWVNTRVRGFDETMMASPPGWGYESTDYVLRVKRMLSLCGGQVGDYPTELVTTLPRSDEERAAPFRVADLETSHSAHAQYSNWYRENHGWAANLGRGWGDE